MNCEHSNVQTGFRKGRGTKYQIANIRWIIEKARGFQKNIYFYFIDYAKTFDCVYYNKMENSLRNGNTRPLSASWEIHMLVKKNRTRHGKMY